LDGFLEAALENFPLPSGGLHGRLGMHSDCSQRNAEAANFTTSSGFLTEVVQQQGGVVL
jgi:hypothetical protein